MKFAIALSRQTAYWRKVINKIIPALGCIFITLDELKEIIYLTTVTAGFPRLIDAAQVMGEVFTVQ